MPDDSFSINTGESVWPSAMPIDTSGLPGPRDLLRETTGDPDVCIAVLDGPVDLSHPCFQGARLTAIESLVSGRAGPGTASQHGTHVAGIIFGQPGTCVSGIAPNCRGLILPLFEDRPDGELAPCSQLDLARGITQAVQEGASIINISGGQIEASGEAHAYLANAVRLCAQNDVLIVAAAGNDGCACLHVPAALPTVLAVGAMDAQGNPLTFSNWGEAYQTRGILAPGENILSAAPGGQTARRTGTSFATPIVSGIAALLMSLQIKRGEKPDPKVIRNAILQTAIGCDEAPAPNCDRLLAGRLNISRAITHLTRGGIDMSDQNATQEERQPQESPREIPELQAGETAQMEAVAPAEQPAPQSPPSPAAAAAAAAAAPVHVTPSATSGQLVYALGQLGVDFGTEARLDSYRQLGVANPNSPADILAHLNTHPAHAAGHTWTLTQETTAIYAIQPTGPFAANVYELLRTFLDDQENNGAERVSVPGVIAGQTRLINGQTVPIIVPDIRGMANWTTSALVQAVLGAPPTDPDELAAYDQQAADIGNFLDRVYYEIRNLGVAPQERAVNYAATNAFQASEVYKSAIEASMKLDRIESERSPICRPDSDCWDVKLTFFNPSQRLEQARMVYRFTIDVSDVVPVTIGETRNWHIY